MSFNFNRDCRNIFSHIRKPAKNGGCMPYDTGNLQKSTSLIWKGKNTAIISISGRLAPYVASLEEGSSPHNIPHAFGRPSPFGESGRFDGKFHPGSRKWVGFIGDRQRGGSFVGYICDYYLKHYPCKIVEK